MKPFDLRIATAEDIEALHLLIVKSVRGLGGNDYTPSQIEGALGHALGLDTQLVSDGTYFVASPRDRPDLIVGSGGWSYRRTLFGSDGGPYRSSAPLNPVTEAAKIRAIFVDPAWARMGLGTLILQHCEAAARSAGFRRAEMGSTLTGIPLYTRMGYAACDHIDVPLPNGEVLPVVLMVKSLQP